MSDDEGDNAMHHDDDEDDDNDQAQRAQAIAQLLQAFNGRQVSRNNTDLIAGLKRQNLLGSPSVEKAMELIPRGLFVPDDHKEDAYWDSPLRLAKLNFNMSAPHMYAVCLSKLNIEPGNACLDIGSGTGHFTALMAYLAGNLGCAVGLDLHQYIIDFSTDNVRKLGKLTGLVLENVRFFNRNCFLPDPDDTLYDRIHVGACCPEKHLDHLYKMLKTGGVLVTPFGDKILRAVKQADGTMTTETLLQVRYSDLVLPSDAEVFEAKKECARIKARRITIPAPVLKESQLAKLGNTDSADIFFVLDGQSVPAHKDILTSRSEVFGAMLSNGMRESASDTVTIPNQDPAAFKRVLQFAYSDDLDFSDCSSCDEIISVLELADYYKFPRLVALCETKLRDSLDCETAGSLLAVADRFNANQLRSCVTEFIFENIQEFLSTGGYQAMEKDLLAHLLSTAVERAQGM
jgi:protein-L-isoaspartate(D-aspartate) O-methyltransferase